MVIFRPRWYYKKLKKIPNVKLIKPNIPSFDLIAKAKLVVTITGTAGWEASFLKKPVITFGNIFYNRLSFVKNCRSYEDLPLIVKNQLEHFQYSEEELVHFIAAILEESAHVSLPYLWEKETNMEKKKAGLVGFTDLIAKKMGLDQKR